MAKKPSAGILLFRRTHDQVEVLLVHPGGPYWKNKDDHAWSIPKGELEDEDPLTAAQRELREETGFILTATPLSLGEAKQPSGKIIHAWAAEQDEDARLAHSNSFSMEWPPRSGRQQTFPEVDRAEWFPIKIAYIKIIPGQAPFLERLQALL